MEFREIYCNNCKKSLGRYNIKFYPESKIGELIKDNHASHLRSGHQLEVKRVQK